MKTGYIKITGIEGNMPIIEVNPVNSTVWMTAYEIADLFGVYTSTVNKYLKAIFKDNLLKESEVTKEYRYTCTDNGECIRTYYNLKIIICLSFRLQSLYTKAFREWIFHIFRNNNRKEEFFAPFIICNLDVNDYSPLNLN
ncbi:hypothetical protein D0T53_07665 [Dysgonomonas sp. 216]|uniref:hypothetical protein n=1 Tax=Dysgonomonas sp. 216 TaxID=2302934 RepID=UPI0013D4A1E7|nr:hypothetical protein [Dysgonomonas sp. 216]NDW18790.1 hypothetical protein [Dysgonomonas sp. 216]